MTSHQPAFPNLLSDDDVRLFSAGRHHRLYDKLGAHLGKQGEQNGVYFAVWAPNAERVSVFGDFNAWQSDANPLRLQTSSGIWEGFVPGAGEGAVYKYHIVSQRNGYTVDKADPFGFQHEGAPQTASVVRSLGYAWGDADWMQARGARNSLSSPISVYEAHLGSWARVPDEGNRSLLYLEMADRLVPYVKERGFTHVQFLPVMEHPFFGSWGYQMTGYFAPTSRFGSPAELMSLIDRFHQAGIGVYLDWVPSHFPNDEHALALMDGSPIYEHPDPRRGFHPDWKSCIFDYGRDEVRSFLISSALFWLDKYHADGIRVDAVSSMVYLDYSRPPGEWTPNEHGGRENLEALRFLRELNEAVYLAFPDAQTIAEESTAWPRVSRPTYADGLGFGMKWDMGWMNDTLRYFRHEPVHRKHHHGELTFRQMYAFSENFMLSLSHDEVVYGKGSLLDQMPGDYISRFNNLRLLLGYQFALPGKKLLFMGDEFGQPSEWNHDSQLEWAALEQPMHRGVLRWVDALNRAYVSEPALHQMDCDPAGFEWIEANDAESSVLSFLRRSAANDDALVIVCNFTPVTRNDYRIGVPRDGVWVEVLNSDGEEFGGSGQGNLGRVTASLTPAQGREHSVSLTLPPLSLLVLKSEAH